MYVLPMDDGTSCGCYTLSAHAVARANGQRKKYPLTQTSASSPQPALAPPLITKHQLITVAKNFWQPLFAQCGIRKNAWMLQFPRFEIAHPEGGRVELAKRIKQHRERLGMSQTDLANAVFVSRQTISNWETDRTYPDVQSLLLLSNLFGVSIDSMVREDSPEMREALAAGSKRMHRLGIVMAAFGLACLVWVVIGIVLDLESAYIVAIGAALFLPASVAAFQIDKMRHDNQLYAYQSVEAYLAGEDPDVSSRYNQRAGEHWVARRVLLTVLAIVVGLCCGWGAAGIISRLLGH